MNQGRIWCVVNPTVGLPLFLGSVALTSLIVHAEVLNHTTWFSSYWNGKAGAKAAAVIPAPEAAPAPAASVAPAAAPAAAAVRDTGTAPATAMLAVTASPPASQ
jgi:light-harvesting protein B-800-850 alpha chain